MILKQSITNRLKCKSRATYNAGTKVYVWQDKLKN